MARTKFLAKVASGVGKPDGLLVVPADRELEFLHPLPVERLWGVGPITADKLRTRGILTVGEVAGLPRRRARVDARRRARAATSTPWPTTATPGRWCVGRRRRSMGSQHALGRRPKSAADIDASLVALVDRVTRRMRAAHRVGRTVVLRLRFDDFSRATRSHTIARATADTRAILAAARDLLATATPLIERQGITLVGVAVTNLDNDDAVQLPLPFDGIDAAALDLALDDVRERFGTKAVSRAVLLGRPRGDDHADAPRLKAAAFPFSPQPAKGCGRRTASPDNRLGGPRRHGQDPHRLLALVGGRHRPGGRGPGGGGGTGHRRRRDGGGGGGGSGGAAGGKKIDVIIKASDSSFWQVMLAGSKQAGGDFGLSVSTFGPTSETNIDEQVQLVENSISRGVAGIVIAPNSSSALNSAIDRARAAGIKVITVDTAVTTASEGFIGTDNVKAGEQAGRKMCDFLTAANKTTGKVLVESSVAGIQSLVDRDAGFRSGLAEKCPNVDSSLQRFNNNDINTAASQVNDALTANTDLLGVFADNNTSGVGAARAIKDNNAADRVPVVAFDSDPQENAALADGSIDALVVQNPYFFGYQGVLQAGMATVDRIPPRVLDPGAVVADKDNMDDAEVKQLLEPPTVQAGS